MSNAVDVEVRLRLRDQASSGLQSAAEKATTATEKAALRAAEAAEKSAQHQRNSFTKLADARERLGVRSEKVIQEEIASTRRAYAQLGAAGFASAQDQERAYTAVQRRVTALTNEMGRLTTAQKKAADEAKRIAQTEADIERGRKATRYGVAAVAGIAAAGYVLKNPAMAAMSFDERLAHMANTAFAERDKTGRKIGMQQLEAAVNKAVGKGGGGTREQAAETLDTLIASGAVGANDAMSMLPQLMRFASAANADPAQLAQIGIRAMQTFKIKADEMPNVLNMALAAGQAGGFELKDMAKWLPQQMAAATLSGMSGRAGFAKLAALNQAAAITAGTKDEAGNNVVNLLAKINSSDTANDAKKLGINLPKYLQEQRAKGLDSVDAFGALVDKTVAGRADYQALQKQLKSAKTDDDKKVALESMATIAQGAGIGKLIQDRQAMMALLGLMNNREYLQEVLGKVRANDVATGGAGDKNYDLISETSAFKLRQAEQQKDIGTKAALDGLTPAIGKAAEAFGDLANKYPVLTGATLLSATSLTALAGAAGIASIAMGGKAIPGMASRLAPIAMGASMVGAAGLAGWGVGSGASWLIDKGIQSATGDKDKTLGTWLYDLFNPEGPLVQAVKPPEGDQPKLDASLHVSVSDDRVSVSRTRLDAAGVNARMDTGNLYTGAPGAGGF